VTLNVASLGWNVIIIIIIVLVLFIVIIIMTIIVVVVVVVVGILLIYWIFFLCFDWCLKLKKVNLTVYMLKKREAKKGKYQLRDKSWVNGIGFKQHLQ
jgi:hypothetical protein